MNQQITKVPAYQKHIFLFLKGITNFKVRSDSLKSVACEGLGNLTASLKVWFDVEKRE